MGCRGGCDRSRDLTIVAQTASSAVVLEARQPWTVPELWKTHRARFPQLLGRRTERAAHNGPQAFVSFALKQEEQEPLQ